MTKARTANSRLARYDAKREFARTTEPAGSKAGPSSPKRRFAIQRHDATCTTTCASSPAALEGDPHDGLKRGELKFSLEGERLHGSRVLVRMKQVVASMPSDNEATADQPER